MRTLSELMNLKGRTALITGGGGHLGSAMGLALAEAGAAVALLDVKLDLAQKQADFITKATGMPVMAVQADLAEEDALRLVPEQVDAWSGSLNILINCAAFVGTSNLEGWVTPFEQQSSKTWRAALEVNLTAPFNLIQASLPYLRNGGKGSIINVGSTYGVVGPDWALYEGTTMGNPAAYGASKGGLLQFTRWLATSLAPDVRVNSICPGGVSRGQPQVFQERYKARTPMARMGVEEDFKGVAVFFASDMSEYITGENIMVDGGWCAW